MSGPDEDHNEVDPRWMEISGDINDLVRSKSPGKWSASFETGKPRPGKKAMTVSYTKRVVVVAAFNA